MCGDTTGMSLLVKVVPVVTFVVVLVLLVCLAFPSVAWLLSSRKDARYVLGWGRAEGSV